MQAIYLKVNRFSDYLIPCVNNWVEIFKLDKKSRIFFICDNPNLRAHIESLIDLSKLQCEWIGSHRDSPELQFLVSKMTGGNWFRAGFAHLTTFLHARDHGFESFWNIDADDIQFFLAPQKSLEVLHEVERTAWERGIDIFSLDFWATLTSGQHWSFGVTFAMNNINWIDTLKQLCSNENILNLYQSRLRVEGRNVDWFFSCMRWIHASPQVETFCVNELRFEHNLPWLYRHAYCGIRYCAQGKYHFSIFENEFGLGDAGSIPIENCVINIDAGLTPRDSYQYLQSQTASDINKFIRIAEAESISKYKPDVSIVITKNPSSACIRSIANQTHKQFQVSFISENPEILSNWSIEYQNLYESQLSLPSGVKILSPKTLDTGGGGGARFLGRYVFFLDGTETLAPNTIEILLETSEKYQTDITQPTSVTVACMINESQTSKNNLWNRGEIPLRGKFIRRKFLQQHKFHFNDAQRFAFECLSFAKTYMVIPNNLIK